jgi:hypothetical protein
MKILDNKTLICLLLCIGCASNDCQCEINDEVAKVNDSTIHASHNWKIWELIEETHLQKMDSEAFRLLISPVFSDREKVLYTLSKSNSNCVLTVKYFNKLENGVLRDSLERNEKYILPQKAWKEFSQAVNDNCFWTLSLESDVQILDGNVWLLEGNKLTENNCTHKRYHMVGRKKGSDSEHFFEICNRLLSLGKGFE